MWVGIGSGGCVKRKTRGESEAWRMPRPSIFEDNPYDVEKPESGVQHTTLGLAGAPTPIRVLDALGPPEMQLHDTKSIDLSFLHDSIQKGDPHSQLYAFHLHVSRRKANPTMGRPSWPDHAARRYSEPGSPQRRFGTHTSTPAQTSLSTARSIEIPDLGSLEGHSLPSVSFRRCRSHSPMENHRAFAESLSPITWRFASLKADLSRRGVIQCARGLSRTRTQQPSFQGSVYTAGVPQAVWLPSLGSCGCKLLAAHFLGG